MQGGKHAQPLGYTIVEVMIFLAITGVMFVMAAGFISGKQATVEFHHGMNEVNGQIKAVVNEVANGEYSSLGSNKCMAGAGSTPSITAGNTAQGANGGASGCIFMGKVMQFNVGGDVFSYDTYTIVGRQVDASTGDPVYTFSAAKPIAVDNSAANSTANLTETHILRSGLQFVKAVTCTSNCSAANPAYTSIGDFGFFGSFGGYSASSGSSNASGTQTVITAVIPGTTSGQTQAATVTQLNNASGWTSLDAPANTYVIGGGRVIVLCFKNGNKFGSITIGGTNGQQFTTDVQTGGGVPSTCLS